MSFIVSTGADAIEDALKPKVDASKVLVSLKSGKVFKVRVPVREIGGELKPFAVVKYFCHSAFGVFNSTPCTKPTGNPDYYDLATDILYKDAKAAEEAGASEADVKVIKDQAYALKAKERYLIGFINLEDGSPIIVDFTSKQGKQIIASLKEYADESATFAFKLSKTGAKSDAKVGFDIIVNPAKGLSEGERTKLTETEGAEFDMKLFEDCLKVNEDVKQLRDIYDFGFDIKRLGIDDELYKKVMEFNKNQQQTAESTNAGTNTQAETAKDKDLGF